MVPAAEKTYLFRVPYYDFCRYIYVLWATGSFQTFQELGMADSRRTLHPNPARRRTPLPQNVPRAQLLSYVELLLSVLHVITTIDNISQKCTYSNSRRPRNEQARP